MADSPQPIFLLADSQLLFWRHDGKLFLERVGQLLRPGSGAKAAYVGASNGDRPEFYDLFRGAMDGIAVRDCRMIPARPSADDLEFFDRADLVLLAGGDVERGWRAFEASGLNRRVVERYRAGALVIGVSAGAVQIGLHGVRQGSGDSVELFDTFQLIPLLVDVHQEPDWRRLTGAMPRLGDYVQGLGIPSGGGAVVHPDMSIEPVRRPLIELSADNGEVRRNLLMPPDETESAAGGEEQGESKADTIAACRRDRRWQP